MPHISPLSSRSCGKVQTVGRSRVRRMTTDWRRDPIPTSASFTQINLLDQQEIFDGASPTSFGISIAIHRPVSYTPSPTGKEMRCFMSIQKTMMRTTRDAPSTPRRETFITPTLLPICCGCKLVRDDTRLSPGRKLWITPQAYRESHGVNPDELALTHTSCPECFMKTQDTLRPNVRVNKTLSSRPGQETTQPGVEVSMQTTC